MAPVPTHVFVSFANVDLDVVRRLATRLTEEGLDVWTGHEKLAPGTLDWEQAVRAAIDGSFAVLLVASPASARSVYVRGELGIASARGLPVFSAWAEGEAWPDCAPLMLTSSQYVDCRGEEFDRGVSRLAEAIRPLAEQAIPSHFARPLLEPFPPSCVAIGLPRTATPSGAARDAAAIMKVGAYASIEALLDELYSAYLRDHYEPLTYGSRWILVEARSEAFGFAVAPWSWLTGARIDRQWVRGHAPADFQILPGTRWQVTAVPADVYGVALSDPRVLGALRATAKSDLALRRDGYLEFRPVSTVEVTSFACAVVCSGRSRFWHQEAAPHTALIQLKPVPEDELRWYAS
jgi:TIR domain